MPFQNARTKASFTIATGAPARSVAPKARPRTSGIRMASK
jgi:hypothetical protein